MKMEIPTAEELRAYQQANFIVGLALYYAARDPHQRNVTVSGLKSETIAMLIKKGYKVSEDADSHIIEW